MQTQVLDSKNALNALDQDTIHEIVQEGRRADDYRQKHITNFERYFRKRFGIRPTRVNWPWPDASNLHLPLIDKTIRRTKPKFIRLVESVVPMAILRSNIKGDDVRFVRAVEREFDEMMRYRMNIIEDVSLGTDKMLERGYFVAKIVQEFTPQQVEEFIHLDRLSPEVRDLYTNPNSDPNDIGFDIAFRHDMDPENDDDVEQIKGAIKELQEGKKVVKFKKQVNLTEQPSIFIRDPIKVVVPPDTTDIQKARMIRDRMTMTTHDIIMKGQSDVWNKANATELVRRLRMSEDQRDMPSTGTHDDMKRQVEMAEENREGLTSVINEQIHDIDQYYFWHKWPGDRVASRSVLDINSKNLDLPLRFIKFPYVDVFGRQDCWPFVQVTFDKVSDRYYSPRGIPQMLDSLQTELTNNHNAKQNHMTIATSLNIKAKRNSNISTNFIPGQPLWVNRMDDVEELRLGSKDVSFDNEERILKSWAEEYVGLPDSSISSPTSLTEPRTKTEIEKISEISGDVSYGDSVIFQIGMNKIFNQIWNRWMQYGSNKIKIQSTDGGLMEISKDEIRRRFRVFPAGNISNSSPEFRRKQSLGNLQLFRNDPLINQTELLREFLADQDERLIDILLVPQGEASQGQIERQIFEIGIIAQGYTSIPKLSDDDEVHLQVINDYLQDENKRRNFPPDRLESLLNHRQAHIVAIEKKRRATSRGGRLQQEIANVAQGVFGRQARQATDIPQQQTNGA